MYPLKPKDKINGEFLLFLLITDNFSDYAIQESMRVAMPKINRDSLLEYIFACPSITEQEEIVEYINNSIKPIDLLTETIQISITKLIEYRSTLIAAAVTGKIDVREAAIV